MAKFKWLKLLPLFLANYSSLLLLLLPSICLLNFAICHLNCLPLTAYCLLLAAYCCLPSQSGRAERDCQSSEVPSATGFPVPRRGLRGSRRSHVLHPSAPKSNCVARAPRCLPHRAIRSVRAYRVVRRCRTIRLARWALHPKQRLYRSPRRALGRARAPVSRSSGLAVYRRPSGYRDK